jgi:hypothetical protein
MIRRIYVVIIFLKQQEFGESLLEIVPLLFLFIANFKLQKKKKKYLIFCLNFKNIFQKQRDGQ